MSIIINNSQPSTPSSPLTPLFREFKAQKELVKSIGKVGAIPPGTEKVKVQLDNYSDHEIYKNHSNFRFAFEFSGDDFLVINNLVKDDPVSGSEIELEFDYYNYFILNQGNYNSEFHLSVIADDADSEVVLIDTIIIQFELQIEGNDLQLSEYEFNIHHYKNTAPAFTKTLDVTSNNTWTLLNHMQLNQNIILINDSDEEYYYGSGNESLELKLSNHINELEVGFYNFKLYFYSNTLSAEVNINIIVSETVGVFWHPESLHFEAIHNVHEAETQTLIVYGETSISIFDYVPWLGVEVEQINSMANFIKIHCTPIDSLNLSEGLYEDKIQLIIDGDPYEVPVSYLINGAWNENYKEDVHFTKDNKEIEFFHQSTEESYLHLTGKIKVRDFEGNEKSITREWQLAYLNQRAHFNLGRELDDYLRLIQTPEGMIFDLESTPVLRFAYKPLSIKLNAREVKYEDETTTALYELPFFYFLRGRKPLTNWLTHQPDMRIRVTRKSKIQLNVFKPTGYVEPIQIKRNGEADSLIFVNPSENYYQSGFMYATLDFSRFHELAAGEVITAMYNGRSKTFIVLDEEVTSTTVYWVNQFEMIDSFEFTGNFRMPLDIEKDVTERFVNWRKFVEQVDLRKSQSIIISTGWIFKENFEIINDIISSGKAFIAGRTVSSGMITSREWIELVPGNAKLVGSDSRKGLYEYEVEFMINRKNEDTIYMR